MNISLETMTALRRHDPLRHEGASLRQLILSDHLAIFTFIDMNPMTSLRQPRIDKASMVHRIEDLTKHKLNVIRNDFENEFMRLRNTCIHNTVFKENMRPEKKLDSV